MMLAFIFDSVGFGEWFVLLTVVLIFVGPQKLPGVAKTIGNYYARFRRTAENFKRQIMEMETEVTKEADNMTDAFRVEGDESKADPAADPTDPLAEGHSEGEGEGENYDDGMYDYMHEDGYHEDGDDFNPEGEEEGAPGGDADVKPDDPAPAPAVDAPSDPAPAPAPAAPAAEPPAEPKE